MFKRGFLNLEALSEVLKPGKGEGGILDSSLSTMLGAFSAHFQGFAYALKTGFLVWLVRDAMSVSRKTKKNTSPH